MDTDNFEFQFPTPTTPSALPNDIVFFGKLTDPAPSSSLPQKDTIPLPLRSDSFGRLTTTTRSIMPSTGENRCRRSTSCRSSKHRIGLFGILKYPVQMDLSEIKMRQARREPAPLPKLPESGGDDWASGGDGDGDGGQSCWELVRPLRRRGLLMNVLAKATFGCIPQF